MRRHLRRLGSLRAPEDLKIMRGFNECGSILMVLRTVLEKTRWELLHSYCGPQAARGSLSCTPALSSSRSKYELNVARRISNTAMLFRPFVAERWPTMGWG